MWEAVVQMSYASIVRVCLWAGHQSDGLRDKAFLMSDSWCQSSELLLWLHAPFPLSLPELWPCYIHPLGAAEACTGHWETPLIKKHEFKSVSGNIDSAAEVSSSNPLNNLNLQIKFLIFHFQFHFINMRVMWWRICKYYAGIDFNLHLLDIIILQTNA